MKKKKQNKKPMYVKFQYFILIFFIVSFVGVIATTYISDSRIDTQTLNFTRILTLNSNPATTDQIFHRIYSLNVTGTINNTDLYTVKGDVYSESVDYVKPYGYRNIVSRVNTYSRNDIATFYGIWEDYAGSEGATAFYYVKEHPCNSTFSSTCTGVGDSSEYGQKQGLSIRFTQMQNGTNKIGIQIDNSDINNNTLSRGLIFRGNFSTGIHANHFGTENYSQAFINAGGFMIQDARILSVINLTGDYVIKARNLDPVNSRHFSILSADGTRAVLAVTDSTFTIGDKTPLRLTGNVTSITCNSGVGGRMYYDANTNKMNYCNTTCWIAWGQTGCN